MNAYGDATLSESPLRRLLVAPRSMELILGRFGTHGQVVAAPFPPFSTRGFGWPAQYEVVLNNLFVDVQSDVSYSSWTSLPL